MYQVDFTDSAKKDLEKHYKSGNKSLNNKIIKIVKELSIHPYTGTGKPEALKYELSGFWSRRLNKEHRIIYKVDDHIVTVTVISAMGHYE